MSQLLAANRDRTRLGAWCLAELAPRVAVHGGIQGLIVNLAQNNPLPELYPGESLQGDDFDVILQAWVPSVAVWRDAFKSFGEALRSRCAKQYDYRITDWTVKHDHVLLPTGQPTSGYKLIRGLVFHPDLGAAAARRQWAHHAQLAVSVHVGTARYTEHWVDEVLTPGGPAVNGFSDLHFPSLEAMRNRHFDSPRGQQEIVHDIGHFIVAGSKRLCGQEYRIK